MVRLSSKSKHGSTSPLPTTSLSDSFRESRAENKRFSTPPPSRKGSDKGVQGLVFSKGGNENEMFTTLSPSQTSPVRYFFGMRNSDKIKRRKDTTGTKYFDHGTGKIATMDTVDDWTINLSQLDVDFRFSCGAHSRLYHVIYKDKPITAKIILLPTDEEDGTMASHMEKQFRREVNFQSNLYHRNVIKLFKMEDVSMGMWVEQFNSSKLVEYVHSVKFCQFECIDDYYTAHYQSPRQMMCMWSELQEGKPQCCNM